MYKSRRSFRALLFAAVVATLSLGVSTDALAEVVQKTELPSYAKFDLKSQVDINPEIALHDERTFVALSQTKSNIVEFEHHFASVIDATVLTGITFYTLDYELNAHERMFNSSADGNISKEDNEVVEVAIYKDHRLRTSQIIF